MTTDREDILNAIADEPLTIAEIVEATGFDTKLVSNRLYAMKAAGLVALENHRYSPAESATKPQNIPQIIPARETKAAANETKPPKRATKARKAKSALPPPPQRLCHTPTVAPASSRSPSPARSCSRSSRVRAPASWARSAVPMRSRSTGL